MRRRDVLDPVALIASFSVRDPESTAITSAPSSRIRETFGDWRAMSTVPM